MIYLDYNATAPVRPEVVEVMAAAMAEPANPSSVHALGRKAKTAIEDARQVVADAVSAWPNEVIFTGSGSEANNMLLRGFDRPLLVSNTEHASIQKLAQRLGGDTLPVDVNGIIRLEILESKLKALGKPALVSVILANNETGVMQQMAEIAKIVHAHDGLLHTDAVQALGKTPLDMNLLGVDAMTLCAHKMGGAVGVGALILRNDIAIKPLLFGGGQELGRRASTENHAAIMGFAKAIEMAGALPSLRDIEADIKRVAPDALIVGEASERLSNTMCVAMPNMGQESQLMQLDLKGVCVSAGSACSSGRIAASHVLEAMGVEPSLAKNAIRVSAGWNTTQEELKSFLQHWTELYNKANKAAA